MHEKMAREFRHGIDDIIRGMVASGLPQAKADQRAEVYNVLQSYIPVLGVESSCEYVCSIMRFGFAVSEKKGYDKNDFFAALIKSLHDIYSRDIEPSRNPGSRALKALAILQDKLNEIVNPEYQRVFPDKD